MVWIHVTTCVKNSKCLPSLSINARSSGYKSTSHNRADVNCFFSGCPEGYGGTGQTCFRCTIDQFKAGFGDGTCAPCSILGPGQTTAGLDGQGSCGKRYNPLKSCCTKVLMSSRLDFGDQFCAACTTLGPAQTTNGLDRQGACGKRSELPISFSCDAAGVSCGARKGNRKRD